MARTFTLREAIRRAKAKADMKRSNFIEQEDWIDFFQEAYDELYDLLISTGEAYETTVTFITIGSPDFEYDLPADFYKAQSWDFEVNQSSNIYVSLRRYNESERNNTVGNVSSIPNGRVRLRYYPEPTKYTDADLDTAIPGIAGYEKMVVSKMAIMALNAEESNSDRLQREYDAYYRRIQEAATERDLGLPSTVSDVYRVENSIYFPSLRYRIYGDKVRFLSTVQMGV